MTTARPPLVTRQQIGDIAIEVDAECGTLARTGDATTIGMMVIAMNRLQAIYEAELAVVLTKAEYDALVESHKFQVTELVEKQRYILQLEVHVSKLKAALAAAHEQLANSAEMLPPQIRPTFSIDYKEATNDTD